MSYKPPVEVLIQCFRSLGRTRRARLLRHERKKTPILCGMRASAWQVGKAG
jgi:hypothetical protein